MAIESTQTMPQGQFQIMTDAGRETLSTAQLFTDKRVVLVSVPGAFTTTCSNEHLPGFMAHADAFLSRGVDTIAFMAVNDVDVMHAWGKDQSVDGKIMMLADGNAEYTSALGLTIDLSAGGMGIRGRRFAILVDNGVATYVALEQPGEFAVSTAEAVLKKL
jgi:peroxiredoxin